MSDLIKAAHLRCTISIKRLYPEWKQANLALDGTPAEKDAFRQWRDKNKAHLKELEAMIGDGLEVDIDAGWPDHEQWKPEPYVEQDLSGWGNALNTSLKGLEDAQQRINTVSMSMTLPEALKDLVADDDTPEQQREYLLKRLIEIGHKIQMGLATADEKDAYSRINANMDWIRGD